MLMQIFLIKETVFDFFLSLKKHIPPTSHFAFTPLFLFQNCALSLKQTVYYKNEISTFKAKI